MGASYTANLVKERRGAANVVVGTKKALLNRTCLSFGVEGDSLNRYYIVCEQISCLGIQVGIQK